MKKLLLFVLLILPNLVFAQSNRNPCVYGVGTNASATLANGNCLAIGYYLSGVTGVPMPVGGIANASAPTFTEGKPGYLSFDLSGNLRTIGSSTVVGTASNATSSVATSSTNLSSVSYNYWWNGTTWDQAKGDTGAALVVNNPTATAASGLAPSPNASATGTNILKASAGNLYGVEVTTGGTAGFLMVLDSTTVPADGAVVPKYCKVVAANSSAELSWTAGPPATFASGITIVFSSTGCFNKTLSATAYITGMSK